MHASDVKDFIYFAERSTLNAAPWKEAGESAVHECCIRFKHFNGRWMWLNQKVIVLSVTPDRHIDHVLLLFDDCTAAKQAELSRHGAQVEKSRKNSKLLNLLAPIKAAQTNTDQQVPASEGCASLTSREREIMQLVSQGSSSKQIAAKLFISKHTVESHRKHILRKLSVKKTRHRWFISQLRHPFECTVKNHHFQGFHALMLRGNLHPLTIKLLNDAN